MAHDERRLEVLRAIVQDYVSTNDPVGSKALAERHDLGVSPATIRNDMAVLEEQGYITQPHTSAGRVPTDKGYRLFVDRLSAVKPLSSAERRAIERFLDGAPSTYAWLPFGGGVRRCLGAAFAEMEMRVAIAEILRRRALAPASSRAERVARRNVTFSPRHGTRIRAARRR